MAISNPSSKATTIKEEYNMLTNDTWTIDKVTLLGNYSNISIVQTDFILDKYEEYFEDYLIEINVDSKYYYNPAMFAKDYYGDPQMDMFVLYFAKMKSLFEFNKPKIKVLDYSHIKDLNKLFTTYKDQIEANHSDPTLFTSETDAGTSSIYINSK